MPKYSFRLIFSSILFYTSILFAQSPGDVLWTKYYGGDAYDEINAVVNAYDSGYFFAGTTQSFGLGRWSNAFIGKTGSNGDSLFTFHFGGSGMDVLTDVIQTPDSNYLAVGFSDSETEFEQVYIIKFNNDGDTLWTKTYGGTGKEIAYAVLPADDDGFIISALTKSMGAGEEDIWILKINNTGDTLWTKTYGTAGNDAAYAICRTSDSSYVLTGVTDFSTLAVLKINNSGDTLWMKSFGGVNFEEGTAVIETSNGDLMVLGHTSSFGAGELDIYLLRLTPDGTLMFEKTFGSSDYEEGRDLIQLNDDEFIIAGNTSQNSTAGFMDYYIISVDSAGEIIWSKIIGTEGPDRCYDLFPAGDGNFLVAGANSQSLQLEDAALTLIKGKDIQTGVDDNTPEIISYFLGNAYPNPFNPVTNIQYRIPEESLVSIKIYDILGNLIAEPVKEFLHPGTYTLKFSTSEYNLSSGVYFYTIKAGDFSSTRKMILTK